MRVKKVVPAEPNCGTKKPFPYCGKLVCKESGERDHNLLARFIEDCWLKQSGKDFAISFVPTDKEAILWVSAKTEKRLNSFLDWTIDLLARGFKQQGATCTTVSK